MKVLTFLALAAVAQAHYDFPALISGSTKTPAVSDVYETLEIVSNSLNIACQVHTRSHLINFAEYMDY